MKVLWFEITTPSRYLGKQSYLGGWQDSLEHVVGDKKEIDLYVSFISKEISTNKDIDNIHYLPINIKLNIFQKIKRLFTWSIDADIYVKEAFKIIEIVKPDIIHIFGTEYPFGLISKYINIPIVIHIQGCIVAYNNAEYPPCYSIDSFIRNSFPNFPRQLYTFIKEAKQETRVRMEREIWKNVEHYMGRTTWDKALVSTMHSKASYHVVNEALREPFLNSDIHWKYCKRDKLTLFTVGIGTFWKGPDMLLKTAIILKALNINYEWFVAGEIRNDIKKVVEKQEKTTFNKNNITILGFQTPEQLIKRMSECTLYVHCAYIDNSPNSICEAQVLGVPIISTHVGGIDSLIHHGINGFIVPANDPWRMAYSIIQYSNDTSLLSMVSKNAETSARKRHNKNQIYNDLIKCYKDILMTNKL